MDFVPDQKRSFHSTIHRKLVAIRLADDYSARFYEAIDNGGIVRRMIITENLRPTRRLHSLNAEVVLDGNRNSRQRTSASLFDVLRTPPRPLAIDLEKRIERLIQPFGCRY